MIGAKIKAERERLGWSRYRLSQESGVLQKHLQQIEDGQTEPSVRIAERLLNAMGRRLEIG